MNCRLCVALCLSAALLLCARESIAQKTQEVDSLPAISNRFAILVGVETYDDANIAPINSGPANDVKRLKSILETYAGFHDDNVFVLSTAKKTGLQPTRPGILEALAKVKNLQNLQKGNGLLLFMFSGHGVAPGNEAFLLPKDAQWTSDQGLLEDTSLSVELLRKRIAETGVKQTIVLLDACRNDPKAAKDVSDNPLTKPFLIDFESLNRGIEASAVIYASSLGKRAYVDVGTHLGYFTEAIAAALSGKASDSKGDVTLGKLIDYIHEAVPKMVARDLGKDVEQIPYPLVAGYGTNLVLAHVRTLSARGSVKVSSSQGTASSPVVSSLPNQASKALAPIFSQFVSYPSGGVFPNSLAVGDFNKDGNTDVVVANSDSNNIGVLLGIGDGSFQEAKSYPAGDSPYSLAVGDFNGDGKLDVAVANIGSHGVPSISILLGRGDGTFDSAKNYPSGEAPTKLVVGDFNGDHKLDLAVGNKLDSSVSILLGNGDGSFQAPVKYSVGSYPYAIAVGDFNEDHKEDLVVGNNASHTVSILLGNGAGAFENTQEYISDTGRWGPYSVMIGDFNHDKHQDLVFTDFSDNAVGVRLGNGDGTFQDLKSYTVHEKGQADRDEGPFDIAVFDFDGDGNLDLATANNANTISLLLGKSDGTFQPAKTYPAGYSPVSLAVGDFNGDHKPDLVVANRIGNSVSVFLNSVFDTQMTLNSSLNPSSSGINITFTATVETEAGVPDGLVEFYSDKLVIGVVPLKDGIATVTTYALSSGVHLVTAKYKGTSAVRGNSVTLTQVVKDH